LLSITRPRCEIFPKEHRQKGRKGDLTPAQHALANVYARQMLTFLYLIVDITSELMCHIEFYLCLDEVFFSSFSSLGAVSSAKDESSCVLYDVFTPFNLINETMSAEKFNAKCLQFYE
jgi:hypothetical protein